MSLKTPNATRNCPMDKSLLSRGSADLNTAVMLAPVAMDLSHSGEGRMRLNKLMSLPWMILDRSRGET